MESKQLIYMFISVLSDYYCILIISIIFIVFI